MEDRGKQKDMEYIMSAYDLLKLEWGRVFKASREFIEQTKNVLFDKKKEEEKDKQSRNQRKIKNIYHQISGERSERTDSVLSKRQDIRGRKKYLERDGNTD